MRKKLLAGSTSVTEPIFIQDTSSTTGAGLGSLVFNSSGLVAEYRREGQSSWTAITLVTATLGTFTSGGLIADGSLTGAYEVGVPNAALAAGVKWAVVRLRGATNMLQVQIFYELDAVNYQDGTALGLSRLDATVSSRATVSGIWQDNTAGDFTVPASVGKSVYTIGSAPGSSGGLATVGGGSIGVNVLTWLGTPPAAVDGSGFVQASVGAMQNGVLTPAALPATGFNYAHGVTFSSDQGGPAVSITTSSFSGLSITSSGGGSALNITNSSTGNAVNFSNSGTGNALRVNGPFVGAAVVQAVWDALTSALTTAGSVGKLIATDLDTNIGSRAATGAQMDLVSAPNATAVTAFANGLLDLASAIDSGSIDTVRETFRILLASAAGKLSGAATTAIAIRDTADTKNRISATVDADGNRSAVAYDPT